MPSRRAPLAAALCLAAAFDARSSAANANAAPAAAASPAAPAAPTAAPEAPHRHLGVEVVAGLGEWIYSGVALRGELAFPSLLRRTGFLRLGYARGFLSDKDREEFETAFAGVGVRTYDRGNLYAGVETGALRYLRWQSDDKSGRREAQWQLAPYFVLAVGARVGPFDLGINFSYPSRGIGLSFGLDF